MTNPTNSQPNNLALWNRLFTTDPAHTKGFQKGGGFSGTAIKPMWAIMRATQEFGPVGKGWGWTEHQHVLAEGGIFTQVSVWYMLDGVRCETGPQWGGTALAPKRKDGSAPVDDEAFKKSTTDAIMKCLSYLGIGADVHMGRFDDSKYVQEATSHYQAAPSSTEDPDTKTIRGFLVQLGECGSIDALKSKHETFKPALGKIKERSPADYEHYVKELERHKARFDVKAAAE
jgi:hypothetical protein